MNTIGYYISKTFPAFVYRRFKERHFERRTAPAATKAVLQGIKLDLTGLSSEIKCGILRGRYEWPEVEICRNLIEPGERILELGGAIGFVGLFCLKQLGAAEVVSVEPNPDSLGRLCLNYKMNKLSAAVIQAALASEDAAFHLNISENFLTDSICRGLKTKNSIEVQGLCFKSILAKTSSNFTALILDVEGAETWLDWSALPCSIKKIILEIHPHILGLSKAYCVLQGALNCGFEVLKKEEQVYGLVRIQPTAQGL